MGRHPRVRRAPGQPRRPRRRRSTVRMSARSRGGPMRAPSPRSAAAVLFLVLGATAFVQAARRQQEDAGARAEPLLVPFLLEEVRVLGVVDSQVLVVNPGPEESALELERLRVLSD